MQRAGERTEFADDDARWGTLMSSAQHGNEDDYRQLLREISSVLSGYFVSRIGACGLSDDCVQEVLLAVHQARHTYDPKRRFRPWLFAIARHKAIDALRRTASRKREETLGDEAIEVVDCSSDIEGAVASGELIAALPEPFREAITLTKLHGLSIGEAASRLALSESALKVRVHRGIKRLRKLLEAESI